jgi:electron transport complex protein RnfE
MKKESSFSVLFKGLLKENPVFVLVLGTCPTLAMSTSVKSAVGMGLAAMAVLIFSNAVISLLRKIIPATVRIPCYIVIIAAFVTVVEMIIHAYLPELYKSLGVYLALITVNCIILGRAEMFAGKNSVGKSILDGIGMGLGFTLAMFMMSTIREVLGAGTFADIPVPFFQDHKIGIFVQAPGGLLVYGLLIAFVNVITKGKVIKKKSFGCEGCPSAGMCSGGCQSAVKEGE